MTSTRIATDTHVTLSYVLYDEQGETVDEAPKSNPLTYVHGHAQILPGLEHALEGMSAGESREIVVGPDDAFGERDDEGVFEVDKADFPESEHVTPGDEFVAQGPDGEAISMRVIEVTPDAFVVDTNHPLAGQTVRFQVEVSEVRPASAEEITRAQLEEAESQIGHVHSAGCDHDHDHGHDHHHGDNGDGHSVHLAKKH
jgi:FKBP-type peptidyl-prolyl cis-trans isomerase SlyD